MTTGARLGFIALIIAIGTGLFWIYQVRQVNIPEDRTLFLVVFLLAAGLGIFALFRKPGTVGGIAAVLAFFVGTMLPFTMAVSPQQLTGSVIEVGNKIPHFIAPDENGELFDSDRLDDHLVLIKFFRGHW